MPWKEEVVQRTLLHKQDNEDGHFVSINVLEFIVAIISYCAAYVVLMAKGWPSDPFPVILNITDNISAMNWTNHACKESMIG